MKICYIAPQGIHTRRWINYFADAGHDIHLITSEESVTEEFGKVKIHTIKRIGPKSRIINYPLNSLPMLVQFKRLIREIEPDIVHAHQIMDTTLLGAVSGFHPFVVTPWGSDVLITPNQSYISRKIVQYVLKKADLITCDAAHIQAPLIKLGAAKQKINLIYFGTDVQRFNPSKRDEKLREDLGFHDSPVIISLRRFEPIYDVASLIKAVPVVLKEIPNAKFVLIEKGSQERELKDLAGNLGVSDSIKFVGWVHPNELPRYIASADVYVSTSLSDAGLAASTAEAMASGLPAIVTDFGDNGEWVKEGVNGFLIPLKSPEVLASKLINLLQDKDKIKQFGQRNREVIEDRNNWEKEMNKMGHIYQELTRV